MRNTALILIAGLTLNGCGLEVAGTAAIGGVTKAEEARQAQKTLESVKLKINAAAEATQQQASEGEKAAER